MILSKYTKIIPNYPQKNDFVIYSLLNDSLCVVNREVFDKLEEANTESQLKETVSKSDYLILKKLRILKYSNEEETCAALLNKVMNFTENLNLIVYLTYKCNLNCSYCFQPYRRKSTTMNKKTADALIKWVILFCKERNIRKLNLLFYGGEPLLNYGILKYIAINISRFSKRTKIKHSFLITTNGTLLDKETIKQLKQYGLSDIQITIDGLKEIHDKRRPFKNGNLSSFECIEKNISLISKVARKIILRMNIDKENMGYVPGLLKMIKNKSLDEKVKLFLMPVGQPVRDWKKGSTKLISSENLATCLLKFYSIAEKMGLTIVPYYPSGVCQFYGKFSFSITPDGSLYKCPNLLQKRFCVGDIYHGVSEQKNDKVRNVGLEECLECKYVLTCAKGCRHQAYVRKKNIRSKFCQKESLDKLMDFYIKHEVQEKLNDNGKTKKS